MTGHLLAAVDVIDAAEEFSEVGFTDPFQEIKAFRFRSDDHLWGLSGNDRQSIQDELTEMIPAIAREVAGRG